MDKTIKLRFGYDEKRFDIVDTDFFRHLPGLTSQEAVEVLGNGERRPARPDPVSVGAIIISGTATAAVTALAAVIKAYLASKKTEITLKGKNKTLVYKGPNLTKEEIEILSELNQLTKDDETVSIHATKSEEKSG